MESSLNLDTASAAGLVSHFTDEPPNQGPESAPSMISQRTNYSLSPIHESAPRKISQLISDSAKIHCKTGCGFYGNPAWDGLCSKCHQDRLEKEEVATGSGSAAIGNLTVEKKDVKGASSDDVFKEINRSSNDSVG